MIHKKLLLAVAVLMVASLALVGVACCGNGNGEATPTATPTASATATAEPTEEPTATPPVGGAPTLKVGDTWTYTVNWKDPPEATDTFVGTVSSATAAGYVIDFVFDDTERKEKASPLNLPVLWLGEMTRTYNADLLWTDMVTKVDVEGYGELDFVLSSETDYTAPLWPLTAGTEWTADYVVDVGGLLQKDYTLTAVVEGMEEVTVPAGTFDCYKIVYSEEDTIRVQEWFSEEVKGAVKKIEELFWHGPDIWELESYSVAP